MKDRIKMVRKANSLNQTQFAECIGLSRIHIAQVETGKAILSDRAIRDICREFRISEKWLRTGDGDMYADRSQNELVAEFLNEVMADVDDSIKKKIVSGLARLDESDWIKVDALIKKLLNKE